MAMWRQLADDDVESLLRVADIIDTELPESHDVVAERLKLFPDGCLALTENGELCGYAISHPIRRRQPPALDSLLGGIALDADQYYIHDVCVLPELRGKGLAAQAISKLLGIAERYSSACLVSVYGTARFWARYGFLPPPSIDEVLLVKVRGYGDDATYLERLKV
ncbi:acyl-CoA N-acyltransferase [Hypoxylon trugodes]|uniref:acyl-CoA N-acyltransferase n=1 Tax=Hypoxylon trugodes TaxID=326681 RepID=UPI0021932815|nr:acyl-CoA N-acyltransferase [Hypoxylon trugodes]KAI1384820.1 acyl-CoA N-acyltransferase [Hypoxylon trugodes]